MYIIVALKLGLKSAVRLLLSKCLTNGKLESRLRQCVCRWRWRLICVLGQLESSTIQGAYERLTAPDLAQSNPPPDAPRDVGYHDLAWGNKTPGGPTGRTGQSSKQWGKQLWNSSFFFCFSVYVAGCTRCWLKETSLWEGAEEAMGQAAVVANEWWMLINEREGDVRPFSVAIARRPTTGAPQYAAVCVYGCIWV